MFNRIVIVGNLTRDVDLRYLNTGVAVAVFGIASNRKYKRQDGTTVDDTCFVDVNMFGRTAEIANQYLRKGSKVLVEGKLQYDTWTDQQGNKRSKHSILGESMVMLDNKSQSDYPQDNTYLGNANYAGNSQGFNQNMRNNYAKNTMGNTPMSNNNMANSNMGNMGNVSMGNTNANQNRGSEGYNANKAQMPDIDIDDEIPF